LGDRATEITLLKKKPDEEAQDAVCGSVQRIGFPDLKTGCDSPIFSAAFLLT
jgi:hypothetical protein